MTDSSAWKAANIEYARAYARNFYANSPERQEAMRRRSSERYAERQRFLDQYKLERGCVDCGYNLHACALAFDHRDPATKKFGIAGRPMVRMEALLVEIAKCDVRCANCHAVRTKSQGLRRGRPRSEADPSFAPRRPRKAHLQPGQSVACPHCGATPQVPCRRPGSSRSTPHTLRLIAAGLPVSDRARRSAESKAPGLYQEYAGPLLPLIEAERERRSVA